MSAHLRQAGAAPVARIDDYDGLCAAAVIYLRMWCSGEGTRASLQRDFASTLGETRGLHAVQALADLCEICVRHGRRPLCHHSLHCRCIGADEACFAQFVATAAHDDHEDAVLMASLLVRVDLALVAAGLAASFGLALKQMNLAAPRDVAQALQSQPTLH